MINFNTDMAIFGALTAEIAANPEETTVSYVNQATSKLFKVDLHGKKVIDLLADILGNKELAKEKFAELLTKESILIEGKLNNRNVRYHSRIDLNKGHLQAAITDITESLFAQERFEYTANALARASEANDEDTGMHVTRINHYAKKLSELLGLDKKFTDSMAILAQLHDVGKTHVHPDILRKPGFLTIEEFEIMKSHTTYGAKIIGDHPRLAIAREIALCHHEKWDGNGYPHGITGEEIPLSARIVAIVDAFDALVSKRPYKKPFTYKDTFEILTKGDNRLAPEKHFAPHILKIFIDNYQLFTQIHTLHNDHNIL